MPKRTDLQKIMVIGSGPIVIGQACEFDYSGTQAIKALRAEGYDLVLVNSNPATIMTDPELAEHTYIEPLTVEHLTAIIHKERPDALLPTVGGQTALNLTLALSKAGVLKQYDVEVIGAKPAAIEIAEDREKFRLAMLEIGLEVPRCRVIKTPQEAVESAQQFGYPVIIRPSFTLGGSGGGIAYNTDECLEIAKRGLELSPVGEVQIDESLLGWKEYELEVMRDAHDNVVIICSIENVDPMGVHTGDSVTVAPAQTLTDREYQRMRNAAIAILRKVGVDTGGSNVQFAVNPKDGRLVVIEMNPRVSRSSALASKATGYPIAKIAAKLAIGYTLDEIPNDITKTTTAAFEPTIDYVVTKIPKFAFEKFPGANPVLTTQMKSVGEVMAIGRTFKESLFKALRSLEALKPYRVPADISKTALTKLLSEPNEHRLHVIVHVLENGWTPAEVNALTHIDPWFLEQMHHLALLQRNLRGQNIASIDNATLRQAKQWGFSDRRLAYLTDTSREVVLNKRKEQGLHPVYKHVDTCAAEFASYTPYLYSSYEQENESIPSKQVKKVMILGSGPNRIGQGIEFDYCCCHAAFALKEMQVESIMVNCNPETVSTDYDTSDRLYFEPLTLEDTLEIIRHEQPDGIIVQFGGQTPLNLTIPLYQAGAPIIGTPPESIELAENRERFSKFLDGLQIPYPEHGFANTLAEAQNVATRLGFPLLLRPSYVLGGRAMAVVYNEHDFISYVNKALDSGLNNGPLLIDRFLEQAIEIDVDALCDGEVCLIAAIMEHIEEAGIHSGDSCCVLPTYQINFEHLAQIRAYTRQMALALKVVGLMNVQFAIANKQVYVLEVNPRASRTVPFVAKATGVPLAKIATRLMLGETLQSLGLTSDLTVSRYFVKAPVFPFAKFLGVDPKLSPEMRSTGEVMGVAHDVGIAFFKAALAAGIRLPAPPERENVPEKQVLLTVSERDHEQVIPIARQLAALGFKLLATKGTAAALERAGLSVEPVLKNSEGRPNCIDLIKNGVISLIINTPLGDSALKDGLAIRTAAVSHNTPCITTLSGAKAAVAAIGKLPNHHRQPVESNALLEVISLQEIHQRT